MIRETGFDRPRRIIVILLPAVVRRHNHPKGATWPSDQTLYTPFAIIIDVDTACPPSKTRRIESNLPGISIENYAPCGVIQLHGQDRELSRNVRAPGNLGRHEVYIVTDTSGGSKVGHEMAVMRMVNAVQPP